ncbi:MAG: outer membrane protein assembly factor [Gammaproteobacteria bacterium]|nr:outer membrane protein assembly factor [Gammaproteobacteria bacterium]MCW8942931.1 outer membrane protein assembly factor [Gammaproteobacteria bacterium]
MIDIKTAAMKTFMKTVVSSFLLMAAAVAQAASMMDGFTDPEDGMFDVSHWLAEKKGFFPVPIIVTEPAVGYGAGAALVFLHDPLAGRVPDGETFDPQSTDAEGKLIPPSVSALFGMYTENDTWMAGGAHMGVWKNDNIRYTGALATGSINIKFYRNILDQDLTVDTTIEPDILYQGLKFRLAGSKFFAGASYLLMDTSNKIGFTSIDPSFKNSSRDAAIIFSLEYDSRNTIFTPTDGISSSIEATLFSEAVGSDTDFEKYKAKIYYFTPLSKTFVLGLRGDIQTISGSDRDIPFYMYPFVSLRGIPVMRYQGETVGVAEAELGWNLTSRWSVLGFAGAGRTTSIADNDKITTVYSKGVGLRYFIARRFGAHVGFDIARGPEDTAFYLQFGHAWR